MNDLAFYFTEGWHHIVSWEAADHILFIAALVATYVLKDWKKVLLLVTAFTVGHLITLALSIFDIIRVDEKWVEFLIPCTIVITAIFNFFRTNDSTKKIQTNYVFALFFGTIHGLGFANNLRFMLARDQQLGWALFGFNVGLELGQIICVLIILSLASFVIYITGLSKKWWVYVLSSTAIVFAAKFAFERFP